MANTFGMGTMGMWVKTNIVKIGGSPFRNLPNKIPFGMRPNFGGTYIPCIYIGILSCDGNGNIQGPG